MLTTQRRAVLYARYSTVLQHERSLEDQFALCRQYAERMGIIIVGVYSDKEKTSTTLFDRDGFIQLMRDAAKGTFNCVLTEHFDRISRAGEDLYGIYNRLSYAGVEMHSVSQGPASPELIGVYALTGSLFMKGLSEKVARGLTGRAREGKFMGGTAYGYRSIPGKPGEREIDEVQAAIVERIFIEYVSGGNPADIARRLKHEGAPAPGRTPWHCDNILASAVDTRVSRGILNNQAYIGRVVYGRTKVVRNPHTGRKIRRPADGPAIVVERPDLRIISDDLWTAAQKRMAERSRPQGKPRRLSTRDPSILGGVVKCSECGGHMVISENARDGSARIKCAAAHHRSDCSHRRSYSQRRLERAVLAGLAEQLADPRLLEAYLEEFYREMREQQKDARADRDRTRRRLDEIEVEQMRLVTAVQKGTLPERLVEAQMRELETERAALAERLVVAERQVDLADLRPDAINRYRKAVADLQQELQRPEQSAESRFAFRTLVQAVTLYPVPKRAPLRFAIHGSLGALLGFDANPATRPVEQIIEENGYSVVPVEERCEDCPASPDSGRAASALAGHTLCLGPFTESRAA